ncbi:hypothetical protein GOODEAATRI_005547, partial [Goodea atripinnis]
SATGSFISPAPPHPTAEAPQGRGLPYRSPTSVGWLISNRSSRLAFQWLMMSASFLLSSSLLPDIVDSVSERQSAPVPLDENFPKRWSTEVETASETNSSRRLFPIFCLFFTAGTFCGPYSSSSTDLLSDLFLLRVRGAPLRAHADSENAHRLLTI